MYTSREDARSDLFLSAAMYLFGPLFVGLVLSFLQLDRLPVVGIALRLVLPLVYTVLVPILLIRYRKESLRDYGLSDGPDPTVPIGLLAAAPLVVAGLLTALLATGDPLEALPMFASSSPGLTTIARVLEWTGVLLLALYVTVKARDAFGGNPLPVGDGVRRVGAIVGGVTLVAALLLGLTLIGQVGFLRALAVLMPPLGVAGGVLLVQRRLGDRATTTLAVLVTPVVIMALRPFAIRLDAIQFLNGVYTAGMFAGVGLTVALIVERTRRGLAVVVLALMIAAFTRLGPGGFGA